MLDLTRQRDLINIERLQKYRVMIIGAGGIGSLLTYTLAKMGIENIQLWDKDVVEAHNIPNQFYPKDFLGRIKVEAMRDVVRMDLGVDIDIKNEFWDGIDLSYEPDAIICGIDSMDGASGRNPLWKNLSKLAPNDMPKKYEEAPLYYLDCRMSAKEMDLNVVLVGDPESHKRYERTLFPDTEAIQDRCTAKVIMYTPCACTLMIGSVLHKLIDGEKVVSSYHMNTKHLTMSKSGHMVG